MSLVLLFLNGLIYIFKNSVLLANMANNDRYNPWKQKLSGVLNNFKSIGSWEPLPKTKMEIECANMKDSMNWRS